MHALEFRNEWAYTLMGPILPVVASYIFRISDVSMLVSL